MALTMPLFVPLLVALLLRLELNEPSMRERVSTFAGVIAAECIWALSIWSTR